MGDRSFFEGPPPDSEEEEPMSTSRTDSAARRLAELEAARPVGAGVLDIEAAFTAHADGVRRFLGRLGLGAMEAEDVTSEVFLIAYEKRERFDPTREVRPWLLGIAAKLAKQHQRRQWVSRLLSLKLGREIESGDRGRDPLESILDVEDSERMRRALAKLPERKRTLLVLREYEGLSAEEIGFALDLPESTVYSALHYARRELLKLYRRELTLEALR